MAHVESVHCPQSCLRARTGSDACARCSAADCLTCFVGLLERRVSWSRDCCSVVVMVVVGFFSTPDLCSIRNSSVTPDRPGGSRSVRSTSLVQLVAIVQLKQVSPPWLVCVRAAGHQLEGGSQRGVSRGVEECAVVCGLQWALCQPHSSAPRMGARSHRP